VNGAEKAPAACEAPHPFRSDPDPDLAENATVGWEGLIHLSFWLQASRRGDGAMAAACKIFMLTLTTALLLLLLCGHQNCFHRMSLVDYIFLFGRRRAGGAMTAAAACRIVLMTVLAAEMLFTLLCGGPQLAAAVTAVTPWEEGQASFYGGQPDGKQPGALRAFTVQYTLLCFTPRPRRPINAICSNCNLAVVPAG